MKEKIWIEKLIELLNEYDPYIASDGEHRDNLWWYAYQWHSAVFPKELAESYIISARYGFIWWLIENKKLKSYRAYKDFISQNYVEFENWAVIPSVNWQLYDSVLCWLAIQDEPIRFLCEIIK